MAVFTAICSSLLKTMFPTSQIFIEGVDLYGTPYWDEPSRNLASILRILHMNGMSTVFAPPGVIDTESDGCPANEFHPGFIEATDGKALLTYAMSADALAG